MKTIVTLLAAMMITGAAFANETAQTQSSKPAIVKKAKKPHAGKKKMAKKGAAAEAPATGADGAKEEHKAAE